MTEKRKAILQMELNTLEIELLKEANVTRRVWLIERIKFLKYQIRNRKQLP